MSRTTRAALVVTSCMALWLLASRRALAEDKQHAREASRRAAHAFDFGEYETALNAFKEAYDAWEHPDFLFNIAQCYRQLNRSEEAIRVYKSYLHHQPKATNADEVRRIIAKLERARSESSATPAAPVRPSKRTMSAEAQSQRRPETGADALSPKPAPSDSASNALTLTDHKPGRPLQIAGACVLGAGALALAAGIALEVLAMQHGNDLTQLDKTSGVFDTTKSDQGPIFDVTGATLLAVGGAAVVTGTVLEVIGWKKNRAQRLAVVPMLAPQQATASLRVRF